VPNLKFTQESIDSLRPPKAGREYYWDQNTAGFGLRITATGKRVWVAKYRVNGKQVMETVATAEQVPTLKEAKARAQKSILKARDGVSPVAEIRQAREQADKNQLTFAIVADRYLREYVERNCRPSTIRETRRIIERDILPGWGERPIAGITSDDIEKLLKGKASSRDRPRTGYQDGAGVQANRTLARLKTLFGWCVRQKLIAGDPTAGIERPVRETSRDRILEDQEIVAFWHACEKLEYPFGKLMQLLLLTGQRKSEVTGMRWNEINLDKRQWTIPKERSKNAKAHVVHLSDLALQIIGSLPNFGDLLFSTTGTTPVSGFSKAKIKVDQHMTQELGDLQPWTIHDLRRTLASGLAQSGFQPQVVDRILNHVSGTIRGVAAVYNRYSYLNERQQALHAWAGYVAKLLRPTDNVESFADRVA